MKIVVIGCGKIGESIIANVCEEGHDITVIDNDPQVINQMVETYDVMGICGSGVNVDIQQNANVGNADLLVAVTVSDEINVLSCLLAHKLGVKDTIARVRNPNYLTYTQKLKDELGLSMTINPEFETAKMIAANLTLPNALKIETFANGKIELIELKIEENSALNGLTLIEFSSKYHLKVLVCAVLRNEDVIIPDGNFILQASDKIFVSASHNNLIKFCNIAFNKIDKLRSMMIIGGGKISYYFCQLIANRKYDIKIVDRELETCERLSLLLPNVDIIHGDGSNQDILESEGILDTDAFLALTGVDEENIIISMYAKKKNVKKIITKVNNHSFHGLLESIGMASIVSPKEIIANQVISYIRAKANSRGSNVKTLYKLVHQKVEALEFYVNKNCKVANIPLKELSLKKNILIAGIIRKNEVIIPDGNTMIYYNDHVIIITADSYLEDLEEILN